MRQTCSLSSVYVSCLCFLSRPKDNLQLPFVKTIWNLSWYTVLYVELANFTFHGNICNLILLFSTPMYATRYLFFHENIRKMSIFLLTARDKWNIKVICWKVEEEWFCFIQNANFHFTSKQELMQLSNSHVESQNTAFSFCCQLWC